MNLFHRAALDHQLEVFVTFIAEMNKLDVAGEGRPKGESGSYHLSGLTTHGDSVLSLALMSSSDPARR
jgi:hypothetical protein